MIMFGNQTKLYSLKMFESSITKLIWKHLQFTSSSQVPAPIIRQIYSIYWNLWRQKCNWHDFAVLGSITNKQMEYIEQNLTKSKD